MAPVQKMRFAVAFFDDPGHVAAAALDLAGEGIARSQMHIVASDDTLATASRQLGLSASNRLTDLVRCLTYGEEAGGQPWIVELLACAAAQNGDAINLAAAHLAGATRTRGETAEPPLQEFWQRGGSVLVVRLEADMTEQEICRIMLRQKSCSVQTHDLRRAS